MAAGRSLAIVPNPERGAGNCGEGMGPAANGRPRRSTLTPALPRTLCRARAARSSWCTSTTAGWRRRCESTAVRPLSDALVMLRQRLSLLYPGPSTVAWGGLSVCGSRVQPAQASASCARPVCAAVRARGEWPHVHAMNSLLNAYARRHRLGDVVSLVADMVQVGGGSSIFSRLA